MNIDHLSGGQDVSFGSQMEFSSQAQLRPQTSAATSQPAGLPASYTMAAPLNEAELTSLLMASPLYQKLEAIKKSIASGGVRTGHKMAPGKYLFLT